MRKVVLSFLASFLFVVAISALVGGVRAKSPFIGEESSSSAELDVFDLQPVPLDLSREAGSTGASASPGIVSSTAQTYTFGYWRNMNPTTYGLYDISMLPPELIVRGADCPRPLAAGPCREGWIIGQLGLILGYSNGVWEPESSPTGNDLWSVQALSATLGVAVGKLGTVLKYDWDSVAQDYVWARYPIPVSSGWVRGVSTILTTTGSHDLVGWAVGDDGALVQGWADEDPIMGRLRYDFTWQAVTPFSPARDLWDVATLSPTDAWAVGGERDTLNNGTIIHYDGSTWSVYQQNVSWGHLSGLYMFPEGDEGWAVGSGGIILHYQGGTWSQVSSPTTAFLRDVAMLSRTDGWAVGANGIFLHYDGSSWQLFTNRLTDPFYMTAVDGRSGTAWAVGPDQFWMYGNVIMKYVTDDGAWAAVTSPTINDLNEVEILSETDGWAVGDKDRDGTVDTVYDEDGIGATVLHWNGEYWARIYQTNPPLPDADLLTLDMVSADDGWAMGEAIGDPSASAVVYWDGQRWAPPPLQPQSPINVDILDVNMLDSTFGWAGSGGDKAVVRYHLNQDGHYWVGFAACGDWRFQINGVSLVPDTPHPWGSWYGWAVGQAQYISGWPWGFIDFGDCSGVNKWRWLGEKTCNCECVLAQHWDGSTVLNAIDMLAPDDGWAVGTSGTERGQVYTYTAGFGWMPVYFGGTGGAYCHTDVCWPSGLNDVVASDTEDLAWLAGYWACDWESTRSAWIMHYDPTMWGWPMKSAYILPEHTFAGVFHQPINGISMYSRDFGFAVGQVGHIFQYPYPNFIIRLRPDVQVVRPGGVATTTVSAISIGGIAPVITLSLESALPAGAQAGFSSPTIELGLDATMRITTSGVTPTGVYSIDVGGTAIFRSGDIYIQATREDRLRLYVTDNPIYGITPDHGPADTLVTITGEGFGSDPGASQRCTTSNHVEFAGQQLPCSAVTSWNDTTITFRPPDDVSLWNGPVQGAVVVRAHNSDSNDNHTFLLEPYISYLDPGCARPGDQVAIHGTTFGNDPGYTLRESAHFNVTLGGTRLWKINVTSWNNNVINVTVPVTGTTSGDVVVTSNAFASNAVTLSSGTIYLPLVLRNQ